MAREKGKKRSKLTKSKPTLRPSPKSSSRTFTTTSWGRFLLNRPFLCSSYLHSCLASDEPSLRDVLAVDRLAHKFGATAIGARARAVTLRLTHPEVLRSHLGDNLSSLQVVEIAHILGCEPALKSAWDIAMMEFKSKKRGAAEMINMAEKTQRNELVGEAYYEAMLQKYHERSLEETKLSIEQRTNLLLGAVRCSNMSEEYQQDRARVSSSGEHLLKPVTRQLNTCFVERCSDLQIPTYDLLKRLETASYLKFTDEASSVDSQDVARFIENAASALKVESARIWVYFMDDFDLHSTLVSDLI